MFFTWQLVNHLNDQLQHSDHWSIKIERDENYVLNLLQQYCFESSFALVLSHA